jgi:hypothetical protein
MHSRFRPPALALVAAVAVSATAVAMGPTWLTTVKRVTAEVSLRSGSDVALIMGGTGMPDPTQAYIDEVNDFFLQPNFPGYEPVGLQTPEEAFPLYGLLSGYDSVAFGVEELNYAITHTYAGDNLVIFGVSQSAMIASLEEQQLAANPPADLGQLHFALLAGPDNPMGGLFERFAGLDNPVVNYALYPPSPTDLFATDIYTGEYDGVSDFPDDLSNLLSVANALAGMEYVHLGYSDLTMEQVQSAVLLGQSGQTDFYMIPTTVLPILQSLYSSSESGKELADFLQPDLQVIVDMGYGNLEHGLLADPGGIDGAVGVGFFDKVDPLAVEAALQLGQVQGIVDATDDYLSSQGDAPLPDYVTTLLDSTSGYDFTSWLDSQFIAGLTELSKWPGNADLNPAVLFDGLPLISGTSFIDGLNQYLTEFYTQISGSL